MRLIKGNSLIAKPFFARTALLLWPAQNTTLHFYGENRAITAHSDTSITAGYQRTWATPTDTGRRCKLTQKRPKTRLEARTFWLWGHLSSTWPRTQYHSSKHRRCLRSCWTVASVPWCWPRLGLEKGGFNTARALAQPPYLQGEQGGPPQGCQCPRLNPACGEHQVKTLFVEHLNASDVTESGGGFCRCRCKAERVNRPNRCVLRGSRTWLVQLLCPARLSLSSKPEGNRSCDEAAARQLINIKQAPKSSFSV